MQKIVPHFWFDTEAKQAATLYTSLFKNSKITNTTTISDTPSGNAEMVTFKLSGQDFMAISAGPIFKLNPSISLFVVFDNEKEIDLVWKKLVKGGKILMPFDKYPWAKKYGWLQDKYGLSWQLSWSEQHQFSQKITPMMMFTKDMAGQAMAAIKMYTKLFPNSKIETLAHYEPGEGDKTEFLKHSQFTLNDQKFMAMDSSAPHEFKFNEAFSLIVNCETQAEIDNYWQKLSAVPDAEQFGWLKDKFGVSWQIVPAAMGKMMASGNQAGIARVTQAFLKMKKFDIATLETAFNQKS